MYKLYSSGDVEGKDIYWKGILFMVDMSSW